MDMDEKEQETKIMPLIEPISMSGWYCTRCETYHPYNMICGPEGFYLDQKTKKIESYGQKLFYWQ
jgi:hypothetical protein